MSLSDAKTAETGTVSCQLWLYDLEQKLSEIGRRVEWMDEEVARDFHDVLTTLSLYLGTRERTAQTDRDVVRCLDRFCDELHAEFLWACD